MAWRQAITQQLKAEAQKLGFTMAGIIPATPGRRLDAYMRWINADMHGQMGYLARPDRLIRRQDLQVILPDVQSIICVGLDYYTQTTPPQIANDPSRGRISNYAWQADYHDIMTPRLQALAEWYQKARGSKVQSRVYVDTGAILERDHAETAGLGFTGKNTMLISPRRGSWLFLGELLITDPLIYDEMPTAMPSCGQCRRCLDACPTQAFTGPYILDARRCISYLTIELKGWIPRELRPLLGNWLYGCDICQEVCPFNRFAQPTDEARFYAADWDAAAPPLLDILALDETEFRERFAHSPIKRIKRTRLLRNACVAAGNWGSATAVPALIRLLSEPQPIIRGHAIWALGQIGGVEAVTAVAAAHQYETDSDVLREMNSVAIA